MDLLAFAASRGDRLKAADTDLAPFVRRALASRDWDELVEAASVLWLEIFQAEAPNADPERFMPRFQSMLSDSLAKTKEEPVNDAQVNRVTYWLATATVNNATFWGNSAHGGNAMRWHTMEDRAVRETHRRADGQIASRDGTFDIGGFDLRYPGEPVGPPEIWINCRCLLVPARVEGAFDVTDAITADGTVEDENPDIVVSNNVTAAVDDPFPNEEEGDGIHVDEEPEDDDPDLLVDEPEEGEELITEIPVHGLIAPESVLSGDYRMFAEGALSNRNLPLPLRYEFISSHGGDTSHVATVGRVDEVWMEEGEGMRWRGVVITSKEWAPAVLEGLTDRTVRGVSLDGDMGVVAVDEDGMPGGMSADNPLVFEEVRVAGLTIVPIPAFQEAYIALGAEFPEELTEEALAAAAQALEDCGCTEGIDLPVVDLTSLTDEELAAYEQMTVVEQFDYALEHGLLASAFAPGTKDGPGWITHPIPTSRIRRYWVSGKGAAKIRWGAPGDFNRCRMQLAKYVQNPDWLAGLCANMHKEAIGVWPGQEGGGHAHSLLASGKPIMSLVAAGVTVRPGAAFKNPNLSGPTATTLEELPDGNLRVFGHLATWGVCHIGIQDTCVTAPHSGTNYAMFRTGTVVTDEGRIAVGQITMGTGHAGLKMNAKSAVAHYDNTGAAVADVVVGEDNHGIWFSGLVRSTATQDQIDALQASALSGDWRRNGVGLELVAALAVNVPGFPIPRTALAASGEMGQESLVAAGVVRVVEPEAPKALGAAEIAGIVRASVAEYRAEEERKSRLAALAPFASKTRESALSRIKAKFGQE